MKLTACKQVVCSFVLFAHLFCLLIYPASKKKVTQLDGHTHRHTEESELKPQHEGNKNSRDQRDQGSAQEGKLE